MQLHENDRRALCGICPAVDQIKQMGVQNYLVVREERRTCSL
jgi:hypothetical protein